MRWRLENQPPPGTRPLLPWAYDKIISYFQRDGDRGDLSAQA